MTSMAGWLAKLFRLDRKRIQASSVDVLNRTDHDEVWSRAVSSDASSELSTGQRQDVRNRARMEVQNNSIARGITLTLANDLIGSGPRLQIIPEDRDSEMQRKNAARISRIWQEWSEATCFAETLLTAKLHKTIDGESFSMLETNPMVEHEVKLNVRNYEADQIGTPWDVRYFTPRNERFYDGIEYDSYGNPLRYYRQRRHPGDTSSFSIEFGKFDPLPADFVCHWFRRDRASMRRGLSELVSVLDLFVDLREYRDAAVGAARQAASMTLAMSSDMPPGESDEISDGPLTEIAFPKNSIFNLPDGWKPTVLKAEHPTLTYDMFTQAIIREIARCLNMPYSIAAGDSSNMNYASGRLDHQTYFRSLDVERKSLERLVLDKILAEWLREARSIPGYLPRMGQFTWRWVFDGRPHVDPQKEAQAAVTAFNHGLLDEEYYWLERYGMSIDEAYDSLRRTTEERKKRGLPLPQSIVVYDTQSPRTGQSTVMDQKQPQQRQQEPAGATSDG